MTGVYKITNPKGQIYIGSSVNIFSRWSMHEYLAYDGLCKVNKSINEYGAKNHVFEIIEHCDKSQRTKREKYWQDYYQSHSGQHLNTSKANNSLFINGKRKRIDSVKKSYYLNINTGIYYNSIKEISEIYGMSESRLKVRICGYRMTENNTPFIRV